MAVVREYNAKTDTTAVEQLENRCEIGPTGGKLSLHTDLLGDPICRIRNSPAYLMLVAEIPGQIVGMIRGCIKTVTCGTRNCDPIPIPIPVYTKLGYILGLRISPAHRRKAIGLKLVREMEEWFTQNGAEYSYMATEHDNEPSVKLFTHKCGYSKFRTPSILVQPVFAHRIAMDKSISVIKLSPADAEVLYRRHFSTTEFFPRDIDSILNNRLSLGTFLAVPRGWSENEPESWAVLSVWNCKEVFRLEVRGASRMRKAAAKLSRVMDGALPWLRLPSIPEVFRPFGFHFLYGVGGKGPNAVRYTKALCGLAHNIAKEEGCVVVATEVGISEPVRAGIPYWRSLSCAEDLWCIKRLKGEGGSDWSKSAPGLSIFVDPREF